MERETSDTKKTNKGRDKAKDKTKEKTNEPKSKSKNSGQASQPSAEKKSQKAQKPQTEKTIPTSDVNIEQNVLPSTKEFTPKKLENTPKLFSHLNDSVEQSNLLYNGSVHPAVLMIGERFSKKTVLGANARCIAFLQASKMIVRDFKLQQHEPTWELENSIKSSLDQLKKSRSIAVSMLNAYEHLKYRIRQLAGDSAQFKEGTKDFINETLEAYTTEQIDKAAEAISNTVQNKISDGDVILTYGCSSLIYRIIDEAHRRRVKFRVFLVDSPPFHEAQELLRRFVSRGISCTCVIVGAVGFIMPEVTKVVLGSHALLANGYVMARTGTAQIALVARSFNVPVLVCCETHKFSQKVQTDSIVFNELGNPSEIFTPKFVKREQSTKGKSHQKFNALNLIYDITPPDLISAVVTEVSILPCTSVPVILRIRPTEAVY